MSCTTLRNWLKPTTRRRHTIDARPGSRRPRLWAEQLEDRTVPSNLLGATASSFAVLGGSTVTNTGPTIVSGNLGVSPGAAITGFPPGIVTGGTVHAADGVVLQAQNEITSAFDLLAGLQVDTSLTDQDLGGLTLIPGVYNFASSAGLTGTLTLDFQGNPDALFVFQIGSTLTTASGASVEIINGGADADGCEVYWQVGSSATLGTATEFIGNIVALTSISLTTGANIEGRALARNGAVTLDTNEVTLPDCATGSNNPQVDLSITKTDGLTTVAPGESLTYTIVVTNNGPNTAFGATVQDAFPSPLTDVSYTSVVTGIGSSSAPSGTNVTSLDDTVTLTSGSSITYTVTGTVAANATEDQLADYTSLGANNTVLPQNITVNGVRADAFTLDGTTYQTTDTTLYLRNETNDHGLGVLSNGEDASVGGDVNELSNQLNLEVIRLQKAEDERWTSLWISSLDGNGSDNNELGTLYWSNSPTPDLSTLGASSFTFRFGDFGSSVEGDLLTLNPAGFDATATYLFFRAGPNPGGTDNDYLVWKATTSAYLLTNSATVAPPDGVPDTNPEDNTDTDTDTIEFTITISGQKFNDFDGDGVRDNGEPGIQGWTVFLDTDNDGVLDPAETWTTTDANGNYTFANLVAGTYRVREAQQIGFTQTTPNPADITAGGGSHISGVLFGNFEQISISGTKFRDTNGNGVRDAGERGMRNWVVYLDANANGRLDTGERRTRTDANGNFSFANLGPGSFRMREVGRLGWIRMTNNPLGSVAMSGVDVSGVEFGNMSATAVGGVVGGGGAGGGAGSNVGKLLLTGGNLATLQNGVFARRVQFVASLYQRVLGTAPDLAGLRHYVRLLQAGFSYQRVAALFVQDHA